MRLGADPFADAEQRDAEVHHRDRLGRAVAQVAEHLPLAL